MLLRRIRQHVTNENWFAVFVDFVIVVVGVYVGIEVSNWNELRQEDQRARESLERIHADLVHDRTAANQRREFWTQVIQYGEAAIEHAESGKLYKGSYGQTILAYFQASQVDPYASVATTYDEMKAAGELRLIKDAKLRTQLADYYVYSNSLQAEHLFQFMPRYREHVRGAIPYEIHRYIWSECHESTSNSQTFMDCELPIEADKGSELLESLRTDPVLVSDLRFWITNLSVARLLIDENMLQVEALLSLVDESRETY